MLAGEFLYKKNCKWQFLKFPGIPEREFPVALIVNVSSTLTIFGLWLAALCLIVDDGRTYVRTDGRTFLPGFIGHL